MKLFSINVLNIFYNFYICYIMPCFTSCYCFSVVSPEMSYKTDETSVCLSVYSSKAVRLLR